MERLEQRFNDLQQTMEEMTREISSLRREFKRRTLVVSILSVALVASIVAVIFVQLNNEHRLRESEARWCPVLRLMVPGPDDTPPETKRGREIVREASQLADAFGCKNVD